MKFQSGRGQFCNGNGHAEQIMSRDATDSSQNPLASMSFHKKFDKYWIRELNNNRYASKFIEIIIAKDD